MIRFVPFLTWLPAVAVAGPIVTDTFSGTASSGAGQWAYKLSTYTITAPVRLVDFAAYLEPDGNNVEVVFALYERTGTDWFGNDQWTLRWDSGNRVLAPGLGFKRSPTVGLDLVPGETYALGVFLTNRDVTYFWADPGDEVVSWGVREGAVYGLDFSAFWVLDPINQDPASHGYHQQVTVEVFEDLDADGFDERVDCDDGDPGVYPGAPEACDGRDDDCDGVADEDVVYVDWYGDSDGDGVGDASDVQTTCDGPPVGTVATVGDCDDSDATVFPGAVEACDGVDDDCDGLVDEDLPTTTWYVDADGDGFGVDVDAIVTCDPAPPSGYATESGDCDDAAASVFPGAPELCNSRDDDCDGRVDDDVVYTEYWADADLDGYGDPAEVRASCNGAPAGYVNDASDCDDMNSAVNPGAVEVCDGLDNDCSGAPEPDEVDSDGDGARDCVDCAPDDPAIYPDADDPCDGTDANCDGVAPTAEECVPVVAEGLRVGCGCQVGGVGSGAWMVAIPLLWRRRRTSAHPRTHRAA